MAEPMAEPAAPRSADSEERLEDLAQALRGSLASLRAAAETLELFPGMEQDQNRRLHGVVADEVRRLGLLIDRLERLGEAATREAAAHEAPDRHTSAEEIVGALATSAAVHLGFAVELDDGKDGGEGDVGDERRLEVSRDAVVAALADLLEALRRELGVAAVRLRRRTVERHAVIDVLWQADAESLEKLRGWQSEALEKRIDGGPGLRPLMHRHGGEAWFNVERAASRAYLRLLLPLAG